MDKKAIAKMVIQFAVDTAKKYAAEDGVENWKDYVARSIDAVWRELSPLMGSAGCDDCDCDSRFASAAAEFVAGLEDA